MRLGLANARLEVAWDLRATAADMALPPDTGLLYPRADARPLEVFGASSRSLPVGGEDAERVEEERPPALLLLDGTWPHARKLYQNNPWLHELPAFRLTPREPGRYRIRGEPDDQSLSTVEAAVQALCLLEPEAADHLARLMEAFDGMIEQQVQVQTARSTGARRRQRYPDPRPLHASLRRDHDRLVLAYLEVGGGKLIQVAAVRVSTGEVLDLTVRPDQCPHDPWLLSQMGLGAADLEGAVSQDEAARAWKDFVGPRPVVAAWNQRTLELLPHVAPGSAAAETLMLKAAYCNLGRGGGGLDEILDREGLDAEAVAARGRAGGRLGQALAVVRLMTHLGVESPS